MAYVREIVIDGHPALRKVAKKVDPREIGEPLFQQLVDDMFETMYAAPGVGLAAPQVNVSKRVFVIDVHQDEHPPAVVINPKFESAEEEVEVTEGCLSVPGMVGEIVRFKQRRRQRARSRRKQDSVGRRRSVRAVPAARNRAPQRRTLRRPRARRPAGSHRRRGRGGRGRGARIERRRRRGGVVAPSLRTIFFGTSAFAVPSLRVAAGRTHVAGVVTQPDRPSGRGHKPTPSPVKEAALDLGLRVYEPLRLKTLADEIPGEIDLFALASYGRILPAALLAIPRLGSLNVHPSLLPKYRGATPIQTALREGERDTGVSVMLMDAGMDTGDIVFQERVAILPDETYGELHDRLAVARCRNARPRARPRGGGSASAPPAAGYRRALPRQFARTIWRSSGRGRRNASSTTCARIRRSPRRVALSPARR